MTRIYCDLQTFMLWSENAQRFADVRHFVALTYQGYTMSDGTEFTGAKSADSLVIEDKYYGEDILHLCMRAVCNMCLYDKLAERSSSQNGPAGNALHENAGYNCGLLFALLKCMHFHPHSTHLSLTGEEAKHSKIMVSTCTDMGPACA